MSFLKKAININRELLLALFESDVSIILTVFSVIAITLLWHLFQLTMPQKFHFLYWLALLFAYLNAIKTGLGL